MRALSKMLRYATEIYRSILGTVKSDTYLPTVANVLTLLYCKWLGLKENEAQPEFKLASTSVNFVKHEDLTCVLIRSVTEIYFFIL